MARIAIIGSGIAGLSTAWLLAGEHDITLFESENRAGGHTHTVRHGKQSVDTGFIVLNDRNYPRFRAFLSALDIPTQPSDMSFGVSIGNGKVEWAGDSLAKMFAQKTLATSVTHWRMLADISRFNRQGKALLAGRKYPRLTLGDFLSRHRYGNAFRARYVLPMAAAIWSAPTRDMLDFPVVPFLRFFDNHGLLNLSDRPQWRTVTGGSDRYVQAVAAVLGERLRLDCPVTQVTRTADAVHLRLDGRETQSFDQVVFACHADTTLALLNDPEPREQSLLSAFQFQRNRAVLHSDPRLMPRRRAVWSSWNYLADRAEVSDQRVSVTYWMNRLQKIGGPKDYFVSLNPLVEPEADSVIREIDYDHPVFNTQAINAQDALASIQGNRGSWYCGAWCGYGFHEDGMAAAERVAEGLGVTAPWSQPSA